MLTEQQFVDLYTTHRTHTHNLCYRFSRSEAQDWTEAIFLKVWESRATFRGMCKPSTWLHRVAVNYCLQQVRKTKNWIPVPVTDELRISYPVQFNTVLIGELLGKMKESEANNMIRFVCGTNTNRPKERYSRYRGRRRANVG